MSIRRGTNKRRADRAERSPGSSSRGRGLARPLEALVFLLPLLVFAEIVSLWAGPRPPPQQDRVIAFHLVRYFLELFGSTGSLMPALAVIIVLLTTHMVSRQPWRVRKSSVARMYLESTALAVPLLLVNRWLRLTGGASTLSGGPKSWWGEAALGVGAGIYEELVFRLVLITVISMVGSDLLRQGHRPVMLIALVISSLLFAAHHHPPFGSDPFSPGRFVFRSAAGLYLGTIFLVRGYGLAAGTHVAYNLIVLTCD